MWGLSSGICYAQEIFWGVFSWKYYDPKFWSVLFTNFQCCRAFYGQTAIHFVDVCFGFITADMLLFSFGTFAVSHKSSASPSVVTAGASCTSSVNMSVSSLFSSTCAWLSSAVPSLLSSISAASCSLVSASSSHLTAGSPSSSSHKMHSFPASKH